MVPYFADSLAYDPAECAGFIADPALPARLEALARRYAVLPAFEVAPVEQGLRGLAAELGQKAGDLIHPTRMALTASKGGPPLFDVAAVLGREATALRLAAFVAFLRGQRQAGATSGQAPADGQSPP
jgi:glutamyl-tRNA synthetase